MRGRFADRIAVVAGATGAIGDDAALPPSAEVYDLRIRPASKARL